MSRKSALEEQLSAALASREQRWIRRRLPDPASSPSPSLSTPNKQLIDFNSNDYLSLSLSPALRSRFISALSSAPSILGSGGSRLLVNGNAHASLEARLANFFGSPAALLFNSGFDANVGFFASIPQEGDAIVYDEHIHASVHDGMRASRVEKKFRRSFGHNRVDELRRILIELRKEKGKNRMSIFVAVESLYSMDGTFAPLKELVDVIEEVFEGGRDVYLVVDEAHATGIYGPQGKGMVAMLGLEDKVFVRLHTFGKALAASGAVVLTNPLVKDYLLNYARPLIYTTSLSYANIIAADCSFDMLMDGTAECLSRHLQELSAYFTDTIRPKLSQITPDLLSLPPHLHHSPPPYSHNISMLESIPASPIVPLMTSHPRSLSAHLHALGMNARPITWPTVPKGKDRIRVCLHACNTKEEVDKLIEGAIEWARAMMIERERVTEENSSEHESESKKRRKTIEGELPGVSFASKL